MSTWLTRILTEEPGYEAELVERYSQRLLAFARQQLPACVRRRVDPEDVVQSVYRSFFHRLKQGRFTFDDSYDIWRLLAAMTFHKAAKAVQFHHRQRRDVSRDSPLPADEHSWAEPTPGPDDVTILFGCLEQLLTTLPEKYRLIVFARLQGASIEQIGKQVERSERTVLRVLAHVQELAAHQLESSA